MATPQNKAFNLRLPPELRAKLEAAKMESRRSLNAEIIIRLQQTFSEWRRL